MHETWFLPSPEKLKLSQCSQLCNYLLNIVCFAGDPIYDLIPTYLDVFRGNSSLLKQFLERYKLPLVRGKPKEESGGDKFARLSYHAM